MGRERHSKTNVDCQGVVAFLTYCGENLMPIGINREILPNSEMYKAILHEKSAPDRRNRVALLRTAHRLLRDKKKNIF